MNFENVLQKLLDLERMNTVTGLKAEDAYCLGLLQPVLQGYPLLPFTGATLRPFCMVHIMNDIIVNNRVSILEFGAGISTVMMGRVIRKNNLKSQVITIEHSQDWFHYIKDCLRREELDKYVTVVHSPLQHCDTSLDNNQWYDTATVEREIAGKKFDMVIIDGPPAWQTGKEKARYPAVPFIIKKLSARFSIYLDDANRAGEKSLIETWEKKFHLKFSHPGKTLAHCSGGDFFFSSPLGYYP